MTDDIGQAALRARLVSELEVARVTGETERLRSALLSSVSHDLRSPLSSMIGAADSLSRYGKDMSSEDRQSLLETISVEGERLDRYIQNLLDMTRLEGGGLNIRSDWVNVRDVLSSVSDISFVYFDDHDVVRHKLVQDIVSAYKKYGEQHLTARRGTRGPGDKRHNGRGGDSGAHS